MDYKYEIISLSVIFVLLVYFYKNRKLPLLSTKFFSIFMITAFVNLVAEVLTVYGLNHYWTISQMLLRLFHQIFIGTLDILIFSLYLYCSFLNSHQKRYTLKQLIPRILPLLLAIIMVIFAPLKYYVGYGVKFSYGPMANTVYLSIFIYMLLTFYVVNGKNKALPKETRRSINVGLCVWIMFALYQFNKPTALISSVGIMLVVLLIFLSFENPKEYQDIETGTLNRRAFHMVVSEYMEGKKHFYLFNIVLRDMENIQNILGHVAVYDVQKQLAGEIEKRTSESIYHFRSDTLTLAFLHKEQADALYKALTEYQFEYKAKDITIVPKLCIHILECPRYAATEDDIYETLDYIRIELHEEEEASAYVDEALIGQKDYYAQVEKLLEEAVTTHGFDVFYQPIYNVEDKSFSSAEALVRLKNNEKIGFVSPEVFVPIAEEKGLIRELGHQVFEKVCEFADKDQLKQKGVQYIEVNLSGVQGTDKDIVEQLTACMKANHIEPSFINLEITETAETTGGDKLKNNMDKLIALGCQFSMDDFGTGYSNFSKMSDGEFSIVKLDKSLLWSCFDEKEDRQKAEVIINNCINMILCLGMKIVAEGVETEEQAAFLIDKGVNYLQGYYYSKPIPQEEYLRFLDCKQGK